jgi:hypothetical protein
MEEIYWKVFGTYTITNNEMPTWIVHGYTAKKKRLTINWARVVESIIKEKTHKDKVKGGKLATMKKETTNSGGNMMPSEDVKISHI